VLRVDAVQLGQSPPSHPLHLYVRPFDGGFVEVLAAQQTLDNATWYQGTADAVRQNLRYVEQPGIEYVLILSGDQLYRMNFQDIDRFTHPS